MSAAPRPGWYPDPAGTPELYRWWDGGGWTEAISESPQAPSPRLHSPADEAEAVRDRPRRSRARAAVALVLCVALFLSATVGVGWVIWAEPRTNQPVGPNGRTSPGGSVGGLDASSRVATLGPASMTLPPPPFMLHPDTLRVARLFDVAFLAEAPVHTARDGVPGWSAAVLLTSLDASTGDDLDEQGERLAERFAERFFPASTRLEGLQVDDHAVDGYPGVQVSAQVHYEVEGLPSRYDQLVAVLVAIDEDTTVAAVSSVPDDSPAAVQQQAAQAVASLSVS